MNRHFWLSIVLFFSFPGWLSTHVFAQAQPTQPLTEDQPITIPESSAIAVSFKTQVVFNPKQKKYNYRYPVTLSLVQPLRDSNGNIIAPVDSLVSAYLKPTSGAAVIEGASIVIGGRVIPIKTTGILVPAQTDPTAFGSEYTPSPGRLSNLSESLLLWLGTSEGTLKAPIQTALGAGLALATGLSQPTPKAIPPVVTIGQGDIYVLTLASTVTLPPIPLQNFESTPASGSQDEAPAEEVPPNEVPADEGSPNEAPADEGSPNEAPMDEAPIEEAPPGNRLPGNRLPGNRLPNQGNLRPETKSSSLLSIFLAQEITSGQSSSLLRPLQPIVLVDRKERSTTARD
jgi:hypothetical protein